MSAYALILPTYFMVVSGIVYDVILEPPGFRSTQDRNTGAVRPVVFLPGLINGQYIIEGLSSGFMFVLGRIEIVIMDRDFDRNRGKSISVPYVSAAVSTLCFEETLLQDLHVAEEEQTIQNLYDTLKTILQL